MVSGQICSPLCGCLSILEPSAPVQVGRCSSWLSEALSTSERTSRRISYSSLVSLCIAGHTTAHDPPPVIVQ